MIIEIQRPELELLVQDEILSGRFLSVDDLITEALQALREKSAIATGALEPGEMLPVTKKNLAQFLLDSPFAGSDLDLERRQGYGRPVDL